MAAAQVRTEAYRDFLLNNPSLIKDKVRGALSCEPPPPPLPYPAAPDMVG